VVRGEQARLRAEALAKLDPADRQLIEWRVVEGATFREIGQRRGYSAPYAHRACHEALQRLRAIYRNLGGTDGSPSGIDSIPQSL
jgi:DNA-directed RNA polymerase specialized sigma24 family protein